MRYFIVVPVVILISFVVIGTSHAQQVPTGVAIDLKSILNIFQSAGGFLYLLGGILAPLTIIVSGIVYFTAGSNPSRTKTAKDILKAGIIGSLILFSSGMIVNTVKGFATDPFKFFGGSTTRLPNGSVCSSGNNCQSYYCNLNLNPPICQ